MSSLIRLCGMTGREGSTRRRGLKGASPSCQLPPSRNDKTAATQRPRTSNLSRLNPRQALGPGGEERVAPALQVSNSSSLAKLVEKGVEALRGLLAAVDADGDRLVRLLVA